MNHKHKLSGYTLNTNDIPIPQGIPNLEVVSQELATKAREQQGPEEWERLQANEATQQARIQVLVRLPYAKSLTHPG